MSNEQPNIGKKVYSLMVTWDVLGAIWIFLTLIVSPAIVAGLYRWAF